MKKFRIVFPFLESEGKFFDSRNQAIKYAEVNEEHAALLSESGVVQALYYPEKQTWINFH